MEHSLDFYQNLLLSVFFVAFSLPIVIVLAMIIARCFNYYSEQIDTIVYATVKRVFRISKKNCSEDQNSFNFHGYIIKRIGVYYFFFFFVYLISASAALLWTKFILRKSFTCEPGDMKQDCFSVDDGTILDCSKFPPTERSATINETGIVCYKLVFAYGKAFIAASGLFTSCLAAFGTICFVISLIASICVPNNNAIIKKKVFWCIQGIVSFFPYLGYMFLGFFVLENSKEDSIEFINLLSLSITMSYAIAFPWSAFQRANHYKELPGVSKIQNP